VPRIVFYFAVTATLLSAFSGRRFVADAARPRVVARLAMGATAPPASSR